MTLTIKPWYLIEDKDEAVKALVNTLYYISEEDHRFEEHLKYLKSYSGKPQSSNMGFYVPKSNNVRKIHANRDKYRVNYNVVKSVIDTLVSKACLNPPKATLITEGSCIKERLNATKLDKAVYIAMKDGGVFKDWAVLVKQALIHGDCDVKVYADEKEKMVKFFRVLPVDNYVHPLDAMYGNPNCRYQTSYISKDTLFARYPEFKEKYEKMYKSDNAKLQSQFITTNKIENERDYSDYVEVVEAWKTKVVEDKPGRHMIVCRYGALLDEEYNMYDFPFARLSWNRPHTGYYSNGIPEQLESKQNQINMILSFITEAADKAKSPKLFVADNGNDKSLTMKTNEIAEVVKYTGTVLPQWQTFSGYPQTEFERLQWMIRSCYEEVGLNQMSSTGKNILGSGASKVALQEFTNIESDRFQEFGKSLDNFMIELCQKTIMALKQLKESGVKEIKGEFRGVMQEIDLECIDFDDDYDFSIVTSSMLPMSSAARKDFAGDLYNSGMVDKVTYLGLLNMPDLEQYNKLELAPRQAIEWQIEKLLETKDEKYLLVNENTDLQYGLKYTISILCQYSMKEEDQESIELLEAFKINLTAKLNELGVVQQQIMEQLQAAPVGQPAKVTKTV